VAAAHSTIAAVLTVANSTVAALVWQQQTAQSWSSCDYATAFAAFNGPQSRHSGGGGRGGGRRCHNNQRREIRTTSTGKGSAPCPFLYNVWPNTISTWSGPSMGGHPFRPSPQHAPLLHPTTVLRCSKWGLPLHRLRPHASASSSAATAAAHPVDWGMD
jgi:hypothetical protein